MPNPSADYITVTTSVQQTGITISVLDLAGRELLSQVVRNSSTRVDLRAFPAGVYYVRLTSQGTVQVGKVIKL